MSKIKRLIAGAGALLMMCTFSSAVSATESYDPYGYDRWGDAVSSQVGYSAEEFVDGKMIKGLYERISVMEGFDFDDDKWKSLLQLKEPSDIFVSHDEKLYIVDKGNNRIIITDFDFELINILDSFEVDGKATKLNAPQGVFVDQYTGSIYICDTDNDRVLKCNSEGVVDKVFTKPTSEIYSQDLTFKPEKVVVDKAGNVYVVVGSVTKGSVMYDINGEFLGFFGANRVEQTSEVIMNAFWNMIATQAQRDRSVRSTAVGFDNFDIDDMGFIYTVSESADVKTDMVKKVNPEGTNILVTLGAEDVVFGDQPPAYWSIYTKNSSIVDIDIGPNGELNLLDFAHGRVFQYDEKANLMFVMGGIGNQLGTFQNAVAIETNDDLIYVVDSRKNGITVFKRTEFGEIVTEATNLYNSGHYDESYGPWTEVVKRDGNYRRAYIGIGNALLGQSRYKEAMKYFKIALSRKRYNRAFEGYRDEILQKWLTPVAVTIIILLIAGFVLKQLEKNGVIRMPWNRKRGA